MHNNLFSVTLIQIKKKYIQKQKEIVYGLYTIRNSRMCYHFFILLSRCSHYLYAVGTQHVIK